MANDELQGLLTRTIQAGELLQEIADEARAAVKELQTARPPPNWAVRLTRWITPWPVVRTLVGLTIVLKSWTTPYLAGQDSQIWLAIRLTWWL